MLSLTHKPLNFGHMKTEYLKNIIRCGQKLLIELIILSNEMVYFYIFLLRFAWNHYYINHLQLCKTI